VTEYVARLGTPDGAVVEQRHRAGSAEALKRELEAKGLHVFAVRTVRRGLRFPFFGFRERLDPIEFLVFNQQLTTLLKAGIPVLQSLELLQRSQASPVFREVLARILDEVRGGVALSDAFANQGGLFPRLYCATIFAGERAGELVPVLERYVHHSQMLETVRRRVKSALMYPMVLISLATGLIGLLLGYVIPRFAAFYLGFGSELPLITRTVLEVGNLVQKNALLIVVSLAVGVVFLRRWSGTEQGGLFFDRLVLRVPFVGAILHFFALSQFIRSLATLLSGGTPLVNSLEIASATVTNRALSGPLLRVAPRVREGQALHASLEATKLFPELSLAMVQVGEATGSLDEMLFNVSQFYDETIEVKLSRLVTLIEPAVLVLMGGIIAGLLLSVYYPMFTMMQRVQ
jgi:type IV pilus assembly protein PilC